MTFASGRLNSHPPYDYGFFVDDVTTPTKIYVVNENGRTIARDIAMASASATIQSYLASKKSYYFGPGVITTALYQTITFGAGFTFLAALDFTGLTDIKFFMHPDGGFKMPTATYADIGTVRLNFMCYLKTNQNIKFYDVNFDGNLTGLTGDATQGFAFIDNGAGYGLRFQNCKFADCLYATYGDPNEYKAGTLNPDADYGVWYVDNIVENCEGGFALHNGPGGAHFRGNLYKDCTRLPALFIDSCSEVDIVGERFRDCEIPISVFDGVWHCNVHDCIFENTANIANSVAIKVVRGGAIGDDKQPCQHVKIYHNQITGFNTVLMNDSQTDIEFKNNTILQGVATALTVITDGPNGVGVTDARGNIGYIAPGEIRTYNFLISTLTENAYNSLDNPFGQDVAILYLDAHVETNATSTSPNIDIGVGASATADYTTLFDDLPGETAGLYRSTVATPGAQTLPILWKSGSGNRYLNASIKGAAATGMVLRCTATIMGLTNDPAIAEKLLGQVAGVGEKTWNLDVCVSDVIFLQKFTAVAGSVEDLRIKCALSANIRMAIYNDNAGAPDALVEHTGTKACVSGWNTIPLEAPATLTATDYWIALKTNIGSSVWGIASTNAARYIPDENSAFPESLGAVTNYSIDLAVAGWGIAT